MPVNFFCQPVVTSADLIAAGLHVGWIALRRATMPDTWGQAMEVPESMLKLMGWEREEPGDQDAKILTPGAVISGCNHIQIHINCKNQRTNYFVK